MLAHIGTALTFNTHGAQTKKLGLMVFSDGGKYYLGWPVSCKPYH